MVSDVTQDFYQMRRQAMVILLKSGNQPPCAVVRPLEPPQRMHKLVFVLIHLHEASGIRTRTARSEFS